jgi:hypothetical protein
MLQHRCKRAARCQPECKPEVDPERQPERQPGVDPLCDSRRSICALSGSPKRRPSARAAALACDTTPRSSVLCATPMQALACATAQAASPASCKSAKPAIPASSKPTPASLNTLKSGRAATAYRAELKPPCEPETARQPASAATSSVIESTTRKRITPSYKNKSHPRVALKKREATLRQRGSSSRRRRNAGESQPLPADAADLAPPVRQRRPLEGEARSASGVGVSISVNASSLDHGRPFRDLSAHKLLVLSRLNARVADDAGA